MIWAILEHPCSSWMKTKHQCVSTDLPRSVKNYAEGLEVSSQEFHITMSGFKKLSGTIGKILVQVVHF